MAHPKDLTSLCVNIFLFSFLKYQEKSPYIWDFILPSIILQRILFCFGPLLMAVCSMGLGSFLQWLFNVYWECLSETNAQKLGAVCLNKQPQEWLSSNEHNWESDGRLFLESGGRKMPALFWLQMSWVNSLRIFMLSIDI